MYIHTNGHHVTRYTHTKPQIIIPITTPPVGGPRRWLQSPPHANPTHARRRGVALECARTTMGTRSCQPTVAQCGGLDGSTRARIGIEIRLKLPPAARMRHRRRKTAIQAAMDELVLPAVGRGDKSQQRSASSTCPLFAPIGMPCGVAKHTPAASAGAPQRTAFGEPPASPTRGRAPTPGDRRGWPRLRTRRKA